MHAYYAFPCTYKELTSVDQTKISSLKMQYNAETACLNDKCERVLKLTGSETPILNLFVN